MTINHCDGHKNIVMVMEFLWICCGVSI